MFSFPPSYSSLSAISSHLSPPIKNDSHIDENLAGCGKTIEWSAGLAQQENTLDNRPKREGS